MLNLTNKLKDILLHNILLKFTSLGLGIVLWVIAVNTNNPVISVTYTLPIELVNTENLKANNFTLLNEKKISDSKIDVQVQATRKNLKFVSKNSDSLKANLNFKDIDATYEQYIGKNFSMPVSISFPNYLNSSNYQITNVYPSNIDILLDNYAEANEQIYYETDGEPAQNYYIEDIDIEPDSLKISGPKSIIDLIKPITLNLSTLGITKGLSAKFPIKIYDKNDNEVTDNLTLTDKYANVTIKIDSYQTVPVEKPQTIGKISDGYVLKNIDYEPKSIEITGKEKNKISSIKLPSIDINQSSLDRTITYDLNKILQDGIKIRKGSADKVTVTLSIAKQNN